MTTVMWECVSHVWGQKRRRWGWTTVNKRQSKRTGEQTIHGDTSLKACTQLKRLDFQYGQDATDWTSPSQPHEGQI